MCAYVCASACVCVRARACQSARDAFLILGNQKQIIREKTQAALEINWAQMEAGNKKKKRKKEGSGCEDTRKVEPGRRAVRG